MSTITGTSVHLPPAGLDPSRTQVAFEPSQHGLDPGLDASAELQALQGPASEALASTDSGDDVLRADAWTSEGPRYFASESSLGAHFQSLSLVDATAQAPDAIAESLSQPIAAAA